MPFNVFEIENTSEFLIPCKFSCIYQNISTFFFEIFIFESLSQVENEPNSLVTVTCIDYSSFETIYEYTIRPSIFKEKIIFFVPKLSHDSFNNRFDNCFDFGSPDHILNDNTQIAKYHWESKVY